MILKNISKFIVNFSYEQVDDNTLKVIKSAFLDFLGITFRGFKEKPSQIAFNTLNDLIPMSRNIEIRSSVIGKDNFKTNTLNAGLINGISSHSLELDDGHRLAHIHPGTIVFPTAIAISEAYRLNGKEFLEAVIVGYTLAILLGDLVNPNHRNQGFHTTGTIGTFVAGAVASKLLKLNENQIINTLGLCGTQAAGLLESDHTGSMGKSLHSGKAVYNGMLSAFLAKNGFVGSESILDGKEGFLNSMALDENLDNFDLNEAIRNLNDINLTKIYFKKYPFCRHIHSSIDTALKLRKSLGKEYNHIERIVVKTYKIASEHDIYEPKSIEDLKQSLPYAVAMTLVCGEINFNKLKLLVNNGLIEKDFGGKKIQDIKNLAKKIIIDYDEELNLVYPSLRPSNIIIKLDESFRGGMFQNTTQIPKGDFENPLSLKELVDKFRELNPSYDVGKLAIIDNLEYYEINQVMNILNNEREYDE